MPDLSIRPGKNKKSKYKSSKPAFLSLLLLILILGAVYGGLVYYNYRLNEEKLQIINSINILKQERRIEKEKEVRLFDKQLNAFSNILSDINYSSGFFDILEGVVLSDISLESLSLKMDDNSVTLKGNAKSYQDLASQIYVFSNSPYITHENLTGLGSGTEGLISFGFDLKFKQSIFDKYSD